MIWSLRSNSWTSCWSSDGKAMELFMCVGFLIGRGKNRPAGSAALNADFERSRQAGGKIETGDGSAALNQTSSGPGRPVEKSNRG